MTASRFVTHALAGLLLAALGPAAHADGFPDEPPPAAAATSLSEPPSRLRRTAHAGRDEAASQAQLELTATAAGPAATTQADTGAGDADRAWPWSDLHAWLVVAGAVALAALSALLRPRQAPLRPDAGPVTRPQATSGIEPLPPARPRPGTRVGSYHFPAPAPGQPAATLLVRGGPLAGQRRALESVRVSIGSVAGNDIVLAGDAYVSARHAQLSFEAGSLYLRDLGSRNGSRLNGLRLAGHPVPLGLDDEIQVGRTTLVVAPAGPAQEAGDEARA